MNIEKLPFEKTHSFSPLFLDFVENKSTLAPFVALPPTIDNFKKKIDEHPFDQARREVLYQVLKSQYNGIEKDKVNDQIETILDHNTYTVTTGHQLNIFTGPLYFIYKIVTVIKACQRLNEAHGDHHFVPVYWMATEDHDFEEISHFNLFGKTYTWQSDQTGPVGRFDTQSLQPLLKELGANAGLFAQSYRQFEKLSDAVRHYVNELFGDQGLIVIDGDDPRLKSQLVPIMKKDIFEGASKKPVEEANQKLNDLGYKTQAFVRDINFFYLKDGLRERIVRQQDTFEVLNTEITFTAATLSKEIEENPVHFSPNVIIRPLYQETILPNVAYTGGPAEVAYWLQLTTLFEVYQTSFPVLLPRSFAMIVDRVTRRKIDKLQLEGEDLFLANHELKAKYLKKIGVQDHLLDQEYLQLSALYEALKSKAGHIDQSLEGMVGAEGARALKSLEKVGKRLKKSIEQKNDTAMNQIDAVKASLFPSGSLQERHDNFLNFYLDDPTLIAELIQTFDPFEMKFHVLWPDE